MRNQRLLLALAVIAAPGCALWPGHVNTPPEVRTICLKGCEVLSDPRAQEICVKACPTETPSEATPRPRPRETVTEAPPTASPTAAPTSVPTSTWVEPSKCYGLAGPGPVFQQRVIEAIDSYCPSHPGKCNPAGRRVLLGNENDYYDSVVAYLQARGLEAWVDVCGGEGRCGEIQVAPGGTRFLAPGSWAEGYHILNGKSGDLDTNNYRGRCEPKWWTSAADSVVGAPTPTAAPSAAPSSTPTRIAQATCPPLLWADANRKNGTPRYPGDEPGKFCWLIDVTPRFLVNGRNLPCNAEKSENCGDAGKVYPFAGEACEPDPESLAVTYQSSQGLAGTFSGYAGRVCGPIGSEFRVTVKVKPGAVDKAGRPIAGTVEPFVYTGTI